MQMTYIPNKSRKRYRRITILPTNWIGIFSPPDYMWLKDKLNLVGAKYQFTLVRSRCIADFYSEDAMRQFMAEWDKAASR